MKNPTIANPESESTYLGACIVDNDVMRENMRTPNHFSDKRNRNLYLCALKMLSKNHGFDLRLLINYLQETNNIDKCGGLVYVSSLVDGLPRMKPDVLKPYLDTLDDCFVTRELYRLATNGTPGTEALKKAHELYLQQATANTPAIKSVTAAELQHQDVEKPKSILGDNLRIERGIHTDHGDAGLGKTQLAMQRLHAIATEGTFLGFQAKQTRAGIITPELHKAYCQERLAKWLTHINEPHSENVVIAAPPDLEEIPRLETEAGCRAIAHFVTSNRLGFLTLDPLTLFWDGPEDVEGYKHLTRQLLKLAHETGVCIDLTHHERKSQGKFGADSHRDAMRGPRILRDRCFAIARLYEKRDRYVYEVTKVNFGPKPDPVWLKKHEHGFFELSDPPPDNSQKKQNNLTRLEGLFEKYGILTTTDITEELEITERTARNYCKEINATSSGKGANTAWSLKSEKK